MTVAHHYYFIVVYRPQLVTALGYLIDLITIVLNFFSSCSHGFLHFTVLRYDIPEDKNKDDYRCTDVEFDVVGMICLCLQPQCRCES